jgi:hypothetical protein
VKGIKSSVHNSDYVVECLDRQPLP